MRTTNGVPIEARFPGQWFQSESGLYQNWMRDYDPTTGRYIEADPLGLVDAASIYGYAGQNPVMNMDPRGECFGPAAPLFWYCVGAAIMIYDYVVDDCYTLDDFLASLYRATTIVLNPCRKLGPLCAMAGNGGGGKGWGGGSNGNKYSSEKEALVEMAKGDKRTGITEGDMQAYKELNRELPDPFPENMVRGPEAHDSGLPTSTEPHGHVGPVGHIPIRPKQ